LKVHVRPDKILQFIRAKKISQNQLAKKIGVTKGYMSKIVKGKYIKPGNRVIAGLLHLTKLPFEELFVVVHDPQPNMVAENLSPYSSDLSSGKIIIINNN
jgi:transcriptional regulator with XRE-family HTH domain